MLKGEHKQRLRDGAIPFTLSFTRLHALNMGGTLLEKTPLAKHLVSVLMLKDIFPKTLTQWLLVGGGAYRFLDTSSKIRGTLKGLG